MLSRGLAEPSYNPSPDHFSSPCWSWSSQRTDPDLLAFQWCGLRIQKSSRHPCLCITSADADSTIVLIKFDCRNCSSKSSKCNKSPSVTLHRFLTFVPLHMSLLSVWAGNVVHHWHSDYGSSIALGAERSWYSKWNILELSIRCSAFCLLSVDVPCWNRQVALAICRELFLQKKQRSVHGGAVVSVSESISVLEFISMSVK